MPSTSTPSFLTAFFLTVWKLSIDFFIQQRPKGKKCWETILDVVLLWSYSNRDLRKGTKCICRSSVPFLFLSSFFFPPTLCLCDLDIQIEMVIFTLYLFIFILKQGLGHLVIYLTLRLPIQKLPECDH